MENVLLQTRESLCLRGAITAEKAERIVVVLHRLASAEDVSKITLYINSEGGDAGAAILLYDAIRRLKKPVIGVVSGRAHSAAAFIVQACARRKAGCKASIMIHDVKIMLSSGIPLVERMVVEGTFRRNLRIWKFHQQKMDYVFAERTGRTIEEIREKCAEGKTMSVFKAKEFGLIDEII